MAELFLGNTQISGGGGTTDLSNYYNKSEIDSSFGETYLVKITNASGYYCYVPRTMSDADKEKILSSLNTNGGIAKSASSTSAFIGNNSNAEGNNTKASGNYSHAESYLTTASGSYSHAEGFVTTASGSYSHAESYLTTASGLASHAEGEMTTASGDYSHAEGRTTTASGKYSHTEGYLTKTNTSAQYSHAEGCYTTTEGYYSHAEGYYTVAKKSYQHAEGIYNSDASTAILIVGNGSTATSSRHNALEVHTSGEVKIPDTYATGEAYEKPMFVLQDKLYQIDSSITALEANSGSGGSADMSNYYNKTHIDTSIGALDASCRTYAPIEYTTFDDYNDLVAEQTVDENKLYIITDLADADDLADYISTTDLETEINSRANSIISTADSSMVFWKNTRVSEADTAITSAKNTAVSAVQSARSSAVSAVESAQTSAVSAVNTAAASIPSFVVMTESAYNLITPDSNTIYFLTE